jgi:hypothetical protein
MHAILRRRVFVERSGLVARGNDVPNFGVTLGKMCDKVHFLPAVLLLALNAGKAETL